jgi:hypothetical protein
MTEQAQPTPPSTQVLYVREEDFEALYANNVLSEASVWDLKVIFGILDQSVQPNRVMQHTSINLPWTQAKVLSYFLRILLAVHELQNGKISIPAAIVPPDPSTITSPEITPEVREAVGKIYKDWLANL